MKYLALDIGNVLVNQNMESFIEPLSRQMNVSKADATHFINRMQHEQDIGVTTVRDQLSTHYNIKSEYILDDLVDAWRKVCMPNWHSISRLESIVWKHSLQVILVSNLGFEHVQHFDKVLQGTTLYTESIHHFSCKLGARKPTPLYFKLLLDLHPTSKGCVYVDDLKENREAGEALGFRAFEYDLSKIDSPKNGPAINKWLDKLDEFIENEKQVFWP